MLKLLLLLPLLAAASPVTRGEDCDDCKCGYVLTQYNNTYYPFYKYSTFTSLPEGQLSGPDALEPVGFTISNDISIGGTGPNGTQSYGSYKNIYVKNGILELVFPGGQKAPGNLTGAEIHSSQGFTGGVFTADMKLSGVNGTVQSIFTYHTAPNSIGPGAGPQDEQDIEVVAASIFEAAPNGTPPGIELTNFDPNDPNNVKNSGTIVPFPNNPTTSYNNYTIAWSKHTQYYYNGQHLNSPPKYSSYNPSYVYLNNWSDGDPQFTYGPPKTDVIQRIKSITMYYKTEEQSGLPNGCSLSQACRV